MAIRVFITGIGTISALGSSIEELFLNLTKKNCIISKIPAEFETNTIFKSKYYVKQPVLSMDKIKFIDKRYSMIMSDSTKMAVLSAFGAIIDSQILKKDAEEIEHEYLENMGIIIGVGMPNLQIAFDSHISHKYGKKMENGRFNRMVIPITMPNSISSWISIIFGTHGINYTINASCASGSYAIGEAYNNILNNRCNVSLAGGVESLADKSGSIMRGFDMLGTLTKADDGIPRPFSNERSGFLYNEGSACIIVLEELELAKKRGAKIYAEIVAYHSNSDAHNIVEMNPDGNKIWEMFKKIIKKGVNIDYLNSHGTGTILNDRIEKDVIMKVFGNKNKQPVINSTKGILGHSLGASGAIETAVVAMSIKSSIIHGNLIDKTDEDLNLNVDTINKKIEFALSSQYGFGGHNALLMLKSYKK